MQFSLMSDFGCHRTSVLGFAQPWSNQSHNINILKLYFMHFTFQLLSLSSVALLIVDECHHCLGELHPYRLIMNQYRQIKGDRGRSNFAMQLMDLRGKASCVGPYCFGA
jgi:hypothetical protein